MSGDRCSPLVLDFEQVIGVVYGYFILRRLKLLFNISFFGCRLGSSFVKPEHLQERVALLLLVVLGRLWLLVVEGASERLVNIILCYELFFFSKFLH